jgi:hypothetical protein
MANRVIYAGDAGIVPFTAVGEIIFSSDEYAQVFWDNEYVAIVPVKDLALT